MLLGSFNYQDLPIAVQAAARANWHVCFTVHRGDDKCGLTIDTISGRYNFTEPVPPVFSVHAFSNSVPLPLGSCLATKQKGRISAAQLKKLSDALFKQTHPTLAIRDPSSARNHFRKCHVRTYCFEIA